MRLGLGLGLVRLGKAMASFVRDGLKLYYPFKDNSPELLLSGATSFDGSDDKIEMNDPIITGTGDFTFSAWIKIGASKTQFICGNYGSGNTSGVEFYVHSSNTIKLYLGGNVESASTVSTGVWSQVAVTRHNGTCQIYINGNINGSSVSLTGNIGGSNNFTIGKGSDYDTEAFTDSIANVGIWNRALSSSEIESIYWKGQYADLKGTELTNLVSWYNLKDTVLGSNLVTNGDFASDSDWTKVNNVTIANGIATMSADSGTADLKQTNPIPADKRSQIQFTILSSDVSSNTGLQLMSTYGIDVSQDDDGNYIKDVGTHTITGTSSSADQLFFRLTSGAGTLTVDDVSVKEVLAKDSTATNNGSIYGATTLTDAYSASSPFLPRIQDKATPKGAVALASGSTSFDGSDDYIDFGNDSSLQINGDITITGWIKPTGTTSNRPIVYKRDSGGTNYQFFMDTSNPPKLKFYDGSGEHASTSALVKDQWNHVAISINSGVSNESIFYINGSLSGVGTNTISGDDANLLIGKHVTDNTFFNGSLANVAIYSDAKTQSQIQDIMFSSYSTLTSALKTNLVSWYDLGSTELGSELVTNGDFLTGDTTGYTIIGTSSGTDVSQNELHQTFASGTANQGLKQENLSIPTGSVFQVSFKAKTGSQATTGARVGISTSNNEAAFAYYAFFKTHGDLTTSYQTFTSENITSTSDLYYFHIIQRNANVGDELYVDDISVKIISALDSQSTNNGAIVGATTNTGYTSSPSGVADPLNYGEVYGGNAVSFDGANDYIDLVNSVEWQKPKAISMWFKATSISSHGSNVYNKDTLIGYANLYWAIQLDVNKKIQYFFYDGSLRSWLTDSTITLGKWHHIAILSDVDSSQIFLDGQSIGSNSLTWDDVTVGVDKQLKLGGTGGGFATQPFTGSMSHVQIFNTALTQDQVRELYTKPELTLPTGIASSALKLDMPMQEGSGVAILDGSGNQNHGTGSGITWATGQEYGFQHPLVRSNNPMRFETSDYVTVPKNAGTQISTGTYSVSVWIKPEGGVDSGTNYEIIDAESFNNNGWLIRLTGSDLKPYARQNQASANSALASTTAVTNGVWSHLVYTFASGTGKWYINGSLINSGSITAPVLGTTDMQIGGRTAQYFDGFINELSIWDSALTANEVTALYNSGLPLLPTTDSGNYASADDLAGYWRNDGVTTWTDRTPLPVELNTPNADFTNFEQITGDSFSVSNGILSVTNGSENSFINYYTDFNPVVGRTYRITVTTSSVSGTGLGLYINNVNSDSYKWDRTFDYTAVNTNPIFLRLFKFGGHNGSGTVNSFSVKILKGGNNGTVAGSPASIIVPEGLNEGRDSQGYYLTDTDSISSGIRLKGAEYISVQDSESLSFGNGTSDSPFSLEAWVKMNDASGFMILTKGAYNVNAEYNFYTNGSDKLHFIIYDESVSATYQGRLYDTALTSFEGQWIHCVATYDGRGGTSAKDGINLYLNGSAVDNANLSGGSYVSMENLGADLIIGKDGSTFAKGSIDEAKVYSKELSATEVLKNYNNGKSAHSN